MKTNGRLGRLVSIDTRDHGYLLPRPLTLSGLPNAKTWLGPTGGAWDQGQTSMCVAYSTGAYLESSPVRNKLKNRGEWLLDFYRDCQRNDEWPGEDYDGTSVRGSMKTLQARGFITEYRWAFDTATILDYVLTIGPMVVGTDWTEPMFETSKGFVRVSPDGKYKVAGGHAYLLVGANRTLRCPDGSKGAFRILNSWGKGWGDSGRAWISILDFGILLNNQGEAAVAVERLVK